MIILRTPPRGTKEYHYKTHHTPVRPSSFEHKEAKGMTLNGVHNTKGNLIPTEEGASLRMQGRYRQRRSRQSRCCCRIPTQLPARQSRCHQSIQ